MKHLKFYIAALLSLFASSSLLHAQAMTAGKVQAFIVQGDVQLVAKDGTASPLKRGQTFGEGNIVKAGSDGQALLVFSNGATMKVLANCQLSVDQFQQAPFDETAEGTFLRLSKDPSKSTTSLDLRNGTLQGEVKQLDQSAGSSFTVNTPAGSAGIRGTIISMSVVRNAAGQVVGITCNCIVGNMAFTPSAAVTSGTNAAAAGTTQTVTNNVANVSVGTGASLQVTLTVDPVTGQITGGGIAGAAMSTATTQALANAVVETINQAKTDNNIAAQPAPTITVTEAPTATTSTGAPATINTSATIAPTPDTASLGTTLPGSPPTSSAPPVVVLPPPPPPPPPPPTNPSVASP